MATVTGHALIEAEDRWLVPTAGTVTQCRLDFAFTLLVAVDRQASFEPRIEQPFVLVEPDGERVVDPKADPMRMTPALRVLRQEVAEAFAFKDGGLELRFHIFVPLPTGISDRPRGWLSARVTFSCPVGVVVLAAG